MVIEVINKTRGFGYGGAKTDECSSDIDESGTCFPDQRCVTAPLMISGVIDDACRYGIQVNVSEQLPVVALLTHDPGLVSTLPQAA